MTTDRSINLDTDLWLAQRDAEFGPADATVVSPRVAAYCGARNLDTDEVNLAAETLVADLADLHRYSNVSLADLRERLVAFRAAADLLIEALPDVCDAPGCTGREAAFFFATATRCHRCYAEERQADPGFLR